MNATVSTWLDLLRLLAAVGVFLGHCDWLWLPGQFRLFRIYGFTDFVLLFFVLSGYLIAFVVDRKERRPFDYAISRLARIYSVALPALVATFAIDALGRHVRPDLYSADWGYTTVHQVRQFVRSFVFMNEVWSSRSMPGSNGPFWSLAYEVWFYIAFGLATFVKGRKRYVAAAGALVVVGPMVAALFPIWLMGVAAYRATSRLRTGPLLAWALFLGPILFIVLFETGMSALGLRVQPEPLFTHRWRLLEDYPIGAAIACHLLGVHALSRQLGPFLRPVGRPIAAAASTTFTLYLFHFPIAQCLHALDPWPEQSWQGSMLLIVGTLSLTVLTSRITEARKMVWQRMFRRAATLSAHVAAVTAAAPQRLLVGVTGSRIELGATQSPVSPCVPRPAGSAATGPRRHQTDRPAQNKITTVLRLLRRVSFLASCSKRSPLTSRLEPMPVQRSLVETVET